ncbi:hypothetical protein BEL04_18315 [Mucilaginibacter sp. PPCGB 2223]|nr:hypothetical protein BEL04_18315 [Mucilaginibacter sp. PPCGB 2223]
MALLTITPGCTNVVTDWVESFGVADAGSAAVFAGCDTEFLVHLTSSKVVAATQAAVNKKKDSFLLFIINKWLINYWLIVTLLYS